MRLCASQWLFIAVVILLAVSSMLSGCGKKGPLYMPDKTQDSPAAEKVVPGKQ